MQECMARQIPVSVKGVNVLDIAEVRDAFAGLRVLQNSSDGISLVRRGQPRSASGSTEENSRRP